MHYASYLIIWVTFIWVIHLTQIRQIRPLMNLLMSGQIFNCVLWQHSCVNYDIIAKARHWRARCTSPKKGNCHYHHTKQGWILSYYCSNNPQMSIKSKLRDTVELCTYNFQSRIQHNPLRLWVLIGPHIRGNVTHEYTQTQSSRTNLYLLLVKFTTQCTTFHTCTTVNYNSKLVTPSL